MDFTCGTNSIAEGVGVEFKEGEKGYGPEGTPDTCPPSHRRIDL
jgi:hypothetical protein